MSAAMIRVRLSFENYSSLFGTPSPSCWFLIDTESNNTISDLENNIKSRFHIPKQLDIGLTLDGFLLPSHEKILVLRDNDSVRVKIHAVVCEPPIAANSLQNNTSGNGGSLCQLTQVVVSPHPNAARETRCSGSAEKEKKKKKRKELNVDVVEDSNVKEGSVKKKSSNLEGETKKLKRKKETRKRKRCSSEENSGKAVRICQNAKLEPDKSESVSEVQSKTKKKLVLSSSESSSEEEVIPVTKSKSVNITKGTNKTESKKAGTTPKTASKTEVTSSSSSSSSDEEEVGRQGLGFKGKSNGKNCVPSDDSEAEQKAAANAEAERKLEELLSSVDAKTKARRRRKKRENQKRSRRNKMDNPDCVSNVKKVHVSDLLGHGDAHVPNPGVPETNPLHVTENKYNGAENVANNEVVANGEAVAMDVVSGAEDQDMVGSFPQKERGDLGGKHGKDYKRDKNNKKNQFHVMTKEEQLNSSYTNCSYIYEYPAHEDMQEEEETESEPEPKDYSGFPLLEGLPKSGDKIAYKVIELSETYSPEISSYKECEILVADAVTRTLVVKLILQSKVKNVGKFDIIDEDYDTTEASSNEMISLAWASLIEPRLIS